eukprot:c2215_g1_i2 orf=37-204(-)
MADPNGNYIVKLAPRSSTSVDDYYHPSQEATTSLIDFKIPNTPGKLGITTIRRKF